MPMNEPPPAAAGGAGHNRVDWQSSLPGGQAAGVEVTVLGPVGVRHDGEPVEVAPRLRRLLAGLVVSAGDVVSIGRLIDIIWAGDEPAGADKAVRTYVSRLRRVLGAEHSIVHSEPGYVLELGTSGLDSVIFDEELDRAVSLLRTADHEEAMHLLDRSLARWTGPAFAGVAEEEWARPEAVRLQERFAVAQEARIEATLASERAESAVSLAQSLVEAEPLRERPRALLMRALHAAGRRAEALRVARAYRRFLAEETGLEVSDDLADLEDRIARDDPNLSGSVRPLRGYELGERIGEGAYSVVHRAVQPGVERNVAVKIIRPELADRPDFIRRFEFEARTVARIEHPNVVPIIDFWREPGAAFLVMRLLDGGSVEQALRRDGPFSADRALRLLDDIGGALDAAHRLSVVHRDVRPANLLLDGDGTTYLGDFGIALPVASVDASPVISPAYAAPEILRSDPVGPSADVFALAVTVFELLAGRTPFAETLVRRELIQRQLTDSVPPLTSVRTDLPTAIDTVLSRATAKDPGDRHATVAALVDDVRAALEPSTRTRRPDARWAGDAENPYVGLHRFDEEDASRFFGREQLVAELVDKMKRRRMVVAVGPSGSGKSSVVRAGLLPEIRRGAIDGSDLWFIAPMLPGSDPVAGLEAALLRVAVNPPSSLREQLTQPGGLLRAIRRVLPDDDSHLVLVVDQFEELFIHVEDPEVRDRFLAELATAVTAPRSPIRVVATLRADHYDAPLRDPNLAELVTDGTVTVRPMTPAELERAITRPAELVGVDVEPALVSELVAGVTASPTALPLLQFSLTELYDRRVADTMLLSSHREAGGLTGALAARAERILIDGQPEDVEAARRIFGRLAAFGEGLDDRRRRARRDEFADDARTQGLLDAFVEARLLTTDRDAATRAPTVEVAHEALLRKWPRLTAWLAADRDLRRSVGGIGQAAATWSAGGRQDSDLYRGPRLDAALDVAERAGDRLVPVDHEFLEASRRHAAVVRDLERRRLQRLRRLVAGTAAALVIALIAGAVAVTQQRSAGRQATAAEAAAAEAESEAARAEAATREAEEEAARAEEETARAQSATAEAELSELSARAAAAAVERPEQALLLALEAYRRDPGIGTRRALTDTLLAGRMGQQVGSLERLMASACGGFASARTISTDGLWEFAVVDGELVRLDLRSGEELRFGEAPRPCTSWWQDPEGGVRWIVSRTLDTYWRTDASDELELTRSPVHGSGLEPERIGGPLIPEPIGDRFLLGRLAGPLADANVEIVVASATTLEEVAPALPELDRHGFDLPAVAANHEAGVYAVAGTELDSAPDRVVFLLDAETGEETGRVPHRSAITALGFADDGRTLLVGGAGGAISTVDVRSGATTEEFTVPNALETLAIGERESDGAIVAVASRSVQVFERGTGPQAGAIDVAPAETARVRADGTVVLVPVADPDTIQIVDPEGGALVESGYGVDPTVLVGFGHGLAATVEAGTVRLLDLATGEISTVDLVMPDGTRFDALGVVPEPGGFLAWDEAGENLVRWRGGEVVDRAELWTSVLDVSVVSRTEVPSDPNLRSVGDDIAGADGGFVGTGAALVFGNSIGRAPPHALYWFDPGADVLDVTSLPFSLPASASVAARTPSGGVYLALDDGSLRTYDAEGQRVDEIRTLLEGPSVVGVDASSGRVALGGAGGVAVVDPRDGDVVRITDVGSVISVGFARDGEVLAIVDAEGDVRLWDVEQSALLGTLWSGSGTAPGSPPWYDRDNDSIWVATSGKVLRFSLDPERWVERSCELVSRELTDDEWRRLVPGDEPKRPACP